MSDSSIRVRYVGDDVRKRAIAQKLEHVLNVYLRERPEILAEVQNEAAREVLRRIFYDPDPAPFASSPLSPLQALEPCKPPTAGTSSAEPPTDSEPDPPT